VAVGKSDQHVGDRCVELDAMLLDELHQRGAPELLRQ